MYKYSIIDDKENVYCKSLYFKHFRDGYGGIRSEADLFIAAIIDDKIVGCMGIVEKDYGFYSFSHLVVHPDHRRKGIGTDIIINAVKLLKDRGAYLIRNHKSSDLMPYKIFDDMGFKLVSIEKFGKHKTKIYELDLA